MALKAPKKSMLGLLAAVMLLATGCVAEGADGTESGAKSATSKEASTKDKPAAAETATPAPSPTPEPLPSVPRVRGLNQDDAAQALIAAGFVVGEITEVPSARPAGTVLRQGIRVGKAMAAGTAVTLSLAVPYPAVPTIVGRSQRAATDILQSAGFQVEVDEETRSSGRDGAVLSQTPAGKELAKPGSVITIVVVHVVQPVAPPVSHSCTPGYSPCLTPASDYDCAGGSGDGPKYTGLVHVTGSDPYDLDRDGDGLGCD
jgi:resuscitation-promoting factor RpfB